MTATLSAIDRLKPNVTKEAPAKAFYFDAAGSMQWAEGDSETIKNVAIMARTGDLVEHWYWGPIVHDFAGMRRKPQVAVDWCHDDDELLGVLDKFDTQSGDLVCMGRIVSLDPEDQAAKIMAWAKHGIPLEASIDWTDDCVFEWLPENMTTQVNGRTIAGPCIIVREWSLRRVAICPSGADRTTSTNLESRANGDRGILSLQWKGTRMSTSNNPPAANPTANPAAIQLTATEAASVTATPGAGDARAQFTAELKRYTDKFGKEDGLEYFHAGMTWEQSLEKHLEKLTTAKATADKAAADAATKLEAVNLGEKDGVPTVANGGSKSAKTTFSACMEAARQKSRAAAAK